MTSEPIPSALTPDNAWQRLVGTWSYAFQATNSLSAMRLEFTADRKLIRSTSLTGGVMPMPMINKTVTDVTMVAINQDAILLTLGPSPIGRGGGMLTIRFTDANRIELENGPTFTRE